MTTVLRSMVVSLGILVDDRDIKDAEESLKGVQEEAQKTENVFARLGTRMRSAFTDYLKTTLLPSLGPSFGRTVADFERGRASLEALTGSAERAASEMRRLQSFAAYSPFDQEDIIQAYRTLSTEGLDVSNSMLTAIGNTAVAMGHTLTQSTEALSDAVQGNVSSLSLFGIDAQSEGDQVALTFDGVTTTIGKNADEISNYLRHIGLTNFSDGIVDQAMTIGGLSSMLTSSFRLLAVELWDGAFGAEGREAMASLVVLVQDMMPAARELGRVFGVAMRGIGEVIDFVRENARLLLVIVGSAGLVWTFYKLRAAIWAAQAAFLALNISAMFIPVLITSIIALIALLIEDFIVFTQGGESMFGLLVDKIRELGAPVLELVERFRNTGRTIVDFFRGIGEQIRGLPTLIKQSFANALQSLTEYFSGTADRLRNIWDWVTGGMQSDALERFGAIGRFFGGLIDMFRPVASWLWSAGRAVFGYWFDSIATTVEQISNMANGPLLRRVGLRFDGLENFSQRLSAFSDQIQRPMPALFGIGGTGTDIVSSVEHDRLIRHGGAVSSTQQNTININATGVGSPEDLRDTVAEPITQQVRNAARDTSGGER